MAEASPFWYMARTLSRRAEMAPAAPADDDGATRTDRMRARLAQGRANARELAAVAGVRTALVGALLKADLAKGRVVRRVACNGAAEYELNPQWQDGLEARLQQALAFLRAQGWRCTPPRS